jgi:hypothetical protein
METEDLAVVFSRGTRNQQVARAGEYFVVAELNKRGAHAVTFAGNMPKIDIIACDQGQNRTVHIQVKTKRGGRTWHASSLDGSLYQAPASSLDEKNYWIFVDLGDSETAPRYWIVPDWWMRNDIYETHNAYLARHGGTRARNPNSHHHAIDEKRLTAWQGKWETLGIL